MIQSDLFRKRQLCFWDLWDTSQGYQTKQILWLLQISATFSWSKKASRNGCAIRQRKAGCCDFLTSRRPESREPGPERPREGVSRCHVASARGSLGAYSQCAKAPANGGCLYNMGNGTCAFGKDCSRPCSAYILQNRLSTISFLPFGCLIPLPLLHLHTGNQLDMQTTRTLFGASRLPLTTKRGNKDYYKGEFGEAPYSRSTTHPLQ